MKTSNIIFWILAIVITLASAYYQRITGPTYPASGSVIFNGKEIKYKLERSCDTSTNCPVKIAVFDNTFKGKLKWKRYKTKDEWTTADMRFEDNMLIAELPKQPSAGKLIYQIRLSKDNSEILIPEDNKEIVIRFKGDVPLVILIIHILLIFVAMLLSTRTGLEFFRKEPDYKKLAWWTLGFIAVGGMVLGPIVQKYAFGEFWTGIPFGYDLTDNKTLFALIAWIIAIIGMYRSKKPGFWILGASIATLIIFAIPHSMFGSELDYSKVN
jgi:hypothetical protein